LKHLEKYKEKLEPKPLNFQGEWKGRSSGAYKWYEIQTSVSYYMDFENPKIVWPDIAKSNRFVMEKSGSYLANTCYFIPDEDYYLLGVLNSKALWFIISGISIPFGERAGQFRYRLFKQYMEKLPIPDADADFRNDISKLSRECEALVLEKYKLTKMVLRRICHVFQGQDFSKPTEKLQEWSSLSFYELGVEIKKTFKLKVSPWTKPQVADDWEPYWEANRKKVDELSSKIVHNEAEINDRVNFLFGLSKNEIKLLIEQVKS